MTDRSIAYAQLILSVMFIGGYFTTLIMFMLGYARVPVDYKEAFSGLLSLLSAGALMLLQFWFSRSRGGTATPSTPGGPT
jgi:hypothetical protein